ncbi:MAG: hypothetical protein WCJ53_15125 [Mycobacteriaceae bacterium]|jgi:hypothetical protein
MKSTITRGLVAACSLAAMAALGFASPAYADPVPPNGQYSLVGGSDQFYVTVASTCATEGCTASLVSNRGWTSVATLTNGRWNYNVTKPDGVVCGDGNYADVVIRYSLDANTLAGTVTADSNGECPGGQVTQAPIQLQKIG